MGHDIMVLAKAIRCWVATVITAIDEAPAAALHNISNQLHCKIIIKVLDNNKLPRHEQDSRMNKTGL